MADPVVLRKISGGRLKTLLADGRSDAKVVEELFLATLGRFPEKQEQQAARERLLACSDRRAAFEDILWALINTREFILNH
jgi:hypothetical protein